MDVGEVRVEAGVPHPVPAGDVAGEVGDVLDGGAEAGRAHRGAVRAGQAAVGDVVPDHAPGAAVEQVLDAVGLEGPSHPPGRVLGDTRGEVEVGPRGRCGTDLVEQLRAALARDLDDEAVPVAVEQLGQPEVERRTAPGLGVRPRAHGHAEAGPARVRAGHRHDEGGLPAGGVRRVLVGAPEEHGVVDAEGAQVAGAHAEEGVRRVLGRPLVGLDREAVIGPVPPPEHLLGGEEHRLGRLRTRGEPEQCPVVAATQSVASGVLVVTPARGQVVDAPDRGVDDRAVLHGGADDGVAPREERVDERLEAVDVDQSGIHREPPGGHGVDVWPVRR